MCIQDWTPSTRHACHARSSLVSGAGDLLGVVPGVDDVKFEPLIDGQRAEDRVIQHLARTERLLASCIAASSSRARSRRTASSTARRSSSPVGRCASAPGGLRETRPRLISANCCTLCLSVVDVASGAPFSRQRSKPFAVPEYARVRCSTISTTDHARDRDARDIRRRRPSWRRATIARHFSRCAIHGLSSAVYNEWFGPVAQW